MCVCVCVCDIYSIRTKIDKIFNHREVTQNLRKEEQCSCLSENKKGRALFFFVFFLLFFFSRDTLT